MSVVAGLAKAAAGTKVLTGRRPARGRPFPRTKRAVVMVAVALLALLAALAALIPACEVRGAISSTSSTSSPALRLRMFGWATAVPRASR